VGALRGTFLTQGITLLEAIVKVPNWLGNWWLGRWDLPLPLINPFGYHFLGFLTLFQNKNLVLTNLGFLNPSFGRFFKKGFGISTFLVGNFLG